MAWQRRTTLDDVHETPSRIWWKRSDGYYVWDADRTYEGGLTWLGFFPDETYLKKEDRRTKLGIPRRWKTAEAAMKTIDTEFPEV